MTGDEKIECHHLIHKIERHVTDMNGPYLETTAILRGLQELRDSILGEGIAGTCEGCRNPILESDLVDAVFTEDGCWLCPPCLRARAAQK